VKKVTKSVPFLAVFLVVFIFFFSLINDTKNDASLTNFAMGSPVTIKVYGEKNGDELCKGAFERISFIDKSYLSHNISTSAVSTLNKDGTVTADKWFCDYLNECVGLAEKSDCFTLFCGEMKSLWKQKTIKIEGTFIFKIIGSCAFDFDILCQFIFLPEV
jgi:hypothetical protein